MSVDEARALIAEVWRAWTEADLDSLGRLLTEDCEWSDTGPGGMKGRTVHGRDAVLDYVTEIHAHAEVHCRLLDIVAGPGGFATVSDSSSTNRKSGVTSAGPRFDRFLLSGSQVAALRHCRHRSNVLSVVGIHGADREDALVVRHWDDPRACGFPADNDLIGRRVRFQRYLDDDHTHCLITFWRSIANVESENSHRAGYVLLDPKTDEPTRTWVSEESFDEFRKLFRWELVSTPPDAV
jgi:hypothetical protein